MIHEPREEVVRVSCDMKQIGFKKNDVVLSVIPSTSPWLLTRPVIELNLHCSDKSNTPPEIFRHRFYELCDHFKNYYRIFTDGSKEGVDDKQLSWWLKQTTNFTAPTVQNEMLEMLSQEIVDTVRNESVQFAVVVDGTTDYSGVEQESVWLHYTDKEMKLHESFIGLY